MANQELSFEVLSLHVGATLIIGPVEDIELLLQLLQEFKVSI